MISRAEPTPPENGTSSSPNANSPLAANVGIDGLIPVRMLNEYSYCPRLAYLEFVQGEWAENLETLEGTFGHRNVDKPDRKQIPARSKSNSKAAKSEETEEEGPTSIHARSLTLSSEQEGLIAKLDLLEIEGETITPVDYKRGKVPDLPEGAYEPERVQICAQGLILRDNGYHCTEGVIYYIASKRRVVIPFDDELIARTRELVRLFRETAISEICPPPLEDSPKCNRCSLVGICLPDETNLLIDQQQLTHERSQLPVKPDGLRKLLPARQNALPLYVQHQGAFVGKSGDRITIKLKGEELSSVRLLDISQVCVFGNVMFSAQAIQQLTNRGISICHLTYGGWFHSMTSGLLHKNIELRIRQYQTAAQANEALQISRQFIAGKIKNCRTLLRRHLSEKEHPVLRQLNEYHRRALRAESAETLLGLEGMAAKEYFAAFFTLLPDQPEFDVDGRNRRPPRDPVNAVLSFLYSLLTKELTVALQSTGFDPMLGFLHRPRYGRPSLALDLAEEFRPLIADSVALTVFNNQEVSPDSFLHKAGAVTMTDAGRKSVIAAYERRLDTEITHPIFGYKVSYRRILEVQSRLLARHLLGELAEYPSFLTR
ncbi:CRISPR-associated endonuclease Cas4g/Cas1g [Rubinisphaera italica]|uniref:CRISPR-associated endonuclease Cas1 n=1 Tax=Rubinisphaera italica TaxID=2527969 RepID=A0A5C5XLD4_9PLAN|nr:CRISPR-associated endonuclease Cas1 [Rubinisphaera italica]TWT63750.1 CRISPR-associated protein Cas4/endonuclease Cas1 fusion [Rubinisphaera italica]